MHRRQVTGSKFTLGKHEARVSPLIGAHRRGILTITHKIRMNPSYEVGPITNGPNAPVQAVHNYRFTFVRTVTLSDSQQGTTALKGGSAVVQLFQFRCLKP